jgi:M6 family metalloprotease-like protein
MAAVAALVVAAVQIGGAPAASAAATVDGDFAAIGPLGPAVTLDLKLIGRGGVPSSGVGAVALNVTATNSTGPSYVTAWPTGAARPTASNLNFVAGQTIPNMVIVPVGDGGRISLYNNAGSVDLVVDVLGWFPTGGDYTGLTPARLLDTRPEGTSADGGFVNTGAFGQGEARALTVVGRGGVPGSGVGAVALNVTVTEPTAPSFLTAWPTGGTRPTASNLNYLPGQTIPNMVIVPVGDGGQISLYNNAGSAHVIVDVLGWFPTGGDYTGLNPARLLDTRADGATIDGGSVATGAFGQGETRALTVVNRGGVPGTGVGAVALNVTVTNTTAPSFLTVWPQGGGRPTASNLNYVAGQTIPNMVIVPVSDGGQISLYNNGGSADVVVDVLGWFPTGGDYTGLNPARLLDTRIPDPLPAFAIGPVRSRFVLRPVLHQVSGTDLIAVWVCDVPATTTHIAYSFGANDMHVDPVEVARISQKSVGAYFDKISAGRYEPKFVPMGRIALENDDGPSDCVDMAQRLSPSPFTNVLATDTNSYGGGQASPGFIYPTDGVINIMQQPPLRTQRYAWIGGGAFDRTHPDLTVVAHELGHTIHWPHSFYGTSFWEYDNPLDVMSGRALDDPCFDVGTPGDAPCLPQSTLAFNRFAAGWIDDSEIAVHDGGVTTVALDVPGGGGTQMVIAGNAADSRALLTIEGRPKLGYDIAQPYGGVVVAIVDQRPGGCNGAGTGGACISTNRRTAPAIGEPNTYGSLLAVGSTTVIGGVTVTVLAQDGGITTVQVSGTFTAPAALPR